MVRKGIFFSLDALIAIIMILAVLPLVPMFYMEKEQTIQPVYFSSDLIQLMSTIKIGDINHTAVVALLNNSNITDLNKTILEQVLRFAVEDREEEAEELLNLTVKGIAPDYYNFGIWIEDFQNPIFTSSDKPITQLISAKQMISGLEKELPVEGLIARVFLSDIDERTNTAYTYFGGYEGDGNITKKLFLPDAIQSIDSAYMELNAGSNFSLYINNIYSGYYNISSDPLGADEWNIISSYLNNLHKGENNISLYFNGTNRYVGGGYFRVGYTTLELELYQDKGTKRYYFPGIDGLINVYSSFYIPGILNKMNISLHYNSNYTMFLTIGNVTVFNKSHDGEITEIVNNAELSSKLNYNLLSQKTIPLRLGLQNVSYVTGIYMAVDTFSVTDISGSMSGSKLTNAKQANKVFIDAILNSSGNRVGLVGYETNVYERDYHTLTFRNSSLLNIINNKWDASGATCICCGINRAVQGFIEQSDSSGLVAYYNFDNNVNDLKNGINGVVNGNERYVSGINNSAFNFSGSTYVSIQNSLLNIGRDATISLWFKLNSTFNSFSTKTQILMEKYYSNSYNMLIALVGTDYNMASVSKGSLVFKIENGGQRYKWTSRTSWNAGQWYHVDVVIDSTNSNNNKVYINGVLDSPGSSGSGSATIGYNDDIRIGGSNADTNQLSGQHYFNGTIDEVRIFNRELVLEEVRGLNRTISLCGNNITEVGEFCDGDVMDCSTGINSGIKRCKDTCNSYESTCNNEERLKAIVVMSDGMANYECTPHQYNPTQAKIDAIQSACNAWQNYNITVHAVGFGSDVDQATLQSIAACGNGSYYYSDIGNLIEIYKQISEEITKAQYKKQQIEIAGPVSTKLFPDSYIEFNYTPSVPSYEYGRIPITIESPRFNNSITNGTFNVPGTAIVYDAKLTSYSGDRWTHNASIKDTDWINFYSLSSYDKQYIMLGDPYIVNIPLSLIKSGDNTVIITTGVGPLDSAGGSPDDRAIYTIGLDLDVNYTGVFEKAEGCVWTNVEFEDGSSKDIAIPSSYSGTTCSFDATTDCDSFDDAINNAVCHLFKQLDIDNDGKLFFKFSSNDLTTDTYSTGKKIPYMWGPIIVDVRVWK